MEATPISTEPVCVDACSANTDGGGAFEDQYANELEFPAAFRRSRRTGKARGIVKMIGGEP